ncbi:MAG: TRAP transporter substrate-binding protein [Planctomycetes bacterium]|nr:TRAP transporter substrate-binding protein [Planctomycetota bacterium]
MAVLGGCKQDQDPATRTYVLKFGHLANEDHIWHESALKLAELVKTRSAGRLTIKVYPNEQLGKELGMINGMRGETVDMTITGESLQNWTSVAGLCAVPYAIRDSNHLAMVAGGDIGREIEQQIIDTVGIRPIAWFERGARNLTSNRPIKTPDDLKGMILRVPNVPLFVKTWASLGAKPTPMAFSEVFTALQQGTIQGQENPYALISSAGFYEVQKYCNLTEHVIGWVYVTVGEKQFQSLPTDLQAILIEAAREMHAFHQARFLETQTALAESLQAKGMTFVTTDKDAFKTRAKDAVLSALTEEQKALYQRMVDIP